ncbi:MAG: VanW family protein, partial [Oscillospiraceae bacterium]|nr:VanW family protein [Oscillospiraceae bacterium]
ELGYYPAPAYVGGKSVDVYGGGVCQVSSTMYYAVLLANLKIVERWCHQFTPAYITWGVDATTYHPWVDFVYENDTDYPIKMLASYNDNTDEVTVSIYGTKVDDTYVRITNSILSSTPSYTEYVEDESLAPGQEDVEQYGYTGYYVRTWRNVYAGDGTLLSSEVEANSDYEMRPTIIHVGPEKKPVPTTPTTPTEPTTPTTPTTPAEPTEPTEPTEPGGGEAGGGSGGGESGGESGGTPGGDEGGNGGE